MEVYPIPRAVISHILGFLEVLDDRGGKEDIYKLANDLKVELGEILNLIKAAEIFGFVETPGGDVILRGAGKHLIEADVNTKKKMIKSVLKSLPLFTYFIHFLEGKEEKKTDRREVLKILKRLLPNENPAKVFQTLVDWGRYAELFGYNPDDDSFYLDTL